MLPRRLAVLLAAAATLCACTTSTAGTGHGGATPPPQTTGLPTAAGGSSGTPTPQGTTPPPSVSAGPRPTKPLRSVTVDVPNGASLLVDIWAQRDDPTCADHAFGKVRDFLSAHPCFSLRRRLATTTVGGHAVGLAISDLGFKGPAEQSYAVAGQFEKLVTQDGTGNLYPLFHEGARLPAGPDDVPSPDAFNAVGQDVGVEVTDAWYLDGPTRANDPALVAMENAIFLQLG